MMDFNAGDRVRKVDYGQDEPKVSVGTVVDVKCDYGEHEVWVVWDGETTRSKDYPYNLEVVEDPYEYGATWKKTGSHEYHPVYDNEWGTLEDAQQQAREFGVGVGEDAKIMRRRKAGPAEDYNG